MRTGDFLLIDQIQIFEAFHELASAGFESRWSPLHRQ
jgi:hypothetical protein